MTSIKLSNLRCTTAITSVLASLLFPSLPLRAEVTYRLVTDSNHLIDRCLYVLVAEDVDIAAATAKSNTFKNIPTIEISRSNGIIPATDGIEEFILSKAMGEKSLIDSDYKKYPFLLKSDKFGSVHYTYSPSNNCIGLYNYFNASIKPKLYTNTAISIDSETHVAHISSYCGDVAYNSYEWAFKASGDDYVINAFSPAASDAHKIQIYRKDVYDLHIINQKPSYQKGDVIKVHTNYYADKSYSGDIYYCFNDGSPLTNDEIWDNKIEKISDSGVTEFSIKGGYPGGNQTLWIVHDISNSLSEAVRIDLKQSLLATSAEAKHFTIPETEGLVVGSHIDFEPKDADVKIFYTLDGQDPVIPSLQKQQTANMISDAGMNEHAGITYDLDERPLIYDGTALYVRYTALKSGYAPSAVSSFEIAGTTTSISSINENSTEYTPIYFNLQGIRISHPLAPGIYLRSVSGKIEKIIVR